MGLLPRLLETGFEGLVASSPYSTANLDPVHGEARSKAQLNLSGALFPGLERSISEHLVDATPKIVLHIARVEEEAISRFDRSF